MTSSPSSDSLKIDSSVRFVLVAPGSPYPRVILEAGDQTSDLVGYYSLREIGLEKLYDRDQPREPLDFLTFFWGRRQRSRIYSSFDVWHKADAYSSERDQLYSLIVDGPYLNALQQSLEKS